LEQEPDGKRHACSEAAPGKVMAAYEDVGGEHDDHREHPLHDDRRNVEKVGQPLLTADLLLRGLRALLGGSETAQKGVYGKADDGEDGDLAERVECTEVDQDDVDDVGASAFLIGIAQEPVARTHALRCGHYCESERSDAKAARHGDDQIATTPQTSMP